jgi:3-dehydroquinate dehydratase-2
LDIRDSSIYGDLNYAELKSLIEIAATKHGFEADIRQSDDEATIISWLHEAADTKTPVIINPAILMTVAPIILKTAVEQKHKICKAYIL